MRRGGHLGRVGDGEGIATLARDYLLAASQGAPTESLGTRLAEAVLDALNGQVPELVLEARDVG